MKKIIYMLGILGFFLICNFSFGQELKISYYDSSRTLISLGLEKNQDIITEISYRLNQTQRQQIYDDFSLTYGNAIVRNAFLGFGTGSDRQGDLKGGKIAATLETAGLSTSVGCVAFFLIAGLNDPKLAINSKDEDGIVARVLLWSGIGIGFGVFLGGRIFSMIRPAIFANKYNAMLKSALLLEEEPAVAFAPIINPVTKEYGLAAQIRL